MLRSSAVIVAAVAFLVVGGIDIYNGNVKLGIASALLAVVNYLFLTA